VALRNVNVSILSMSLIGALGSAGGERLFFNFVNRNREALRGR
jgi:hypothetical protein